MSTSLFECDKIGWIALCVIKYGEIHWVTEIVYNRIVQNVRRLLSCFCWWHLIPYCPTVYSPEYRGTFSCVLGYLVWSRCRWQSFQHSQQNLPLSMFHGCEFKNIIWISWTSETGSWIEYGRINSYTFNSFYPSTSRKQLIQCMLAKSVLLKFWTWC